MTIPRGTMPPKRHELPPLFESLGTHLRDGLRQVVARLPIEPPSFVLARVLDRVLLPRLAHDTRQALQGRTVELVISDLGIRVRLQLDYAGFRVASSRGEAELRILAPANSYIRLMRGEDDADRLFFERALVMEGDTELGLILKNALDAIGPLLTWPGRPA